ncbi:ABC transporter C-terminal domain-containing protein, partial [Oharaeibacter diazotrophicus]
AARAAARTRAEERPDAARPSAAAAPAPAKTKAKLSFKDKHALETLPTVISTLEAEIADLKTRLADTRFYARDPQAFAATADLLVEKQKKLSDAEDEWLRLEMLREDLSD